MRGDRGRAGDRSMKIGILALLGLVLLCVGCGHPVSPTTDPEAVIVSLKDASGNVKWMCLAVTGGGMGAMAVPAGLVVWEPHEGTQCYDTDRPKGGR